jgi:hypothetical protein
MPHSILGGHVPPRDVGADPDVWPSISCRRAHISGGSAFLPLGNNGSSTAPCLSVRSPRATGQVAPRPRSTFGARPR